MVFSHRSRRARLLRRWLLRRCMAPTGLAARQLHGPDKVVATINGKPITEADLTLAETDLDQQFAQLPAEQRRAAALSALIEIRLLAAKAEAKGLDKDAGFPAPDGVPAAARAAQRSSSRQRSPPRSPTQDVRARYDKEIADTPPVNEVHARHILVKTKEEAQDIIKQLDAGAEFRSSPRSTPAIRAARPRRRPRLFRTGPDGAGIREGGIRAARSATTPRSRCRASSAGM